ncbi:MAG: N-acetylmuramoyl-L-alanine amidase [Bacteroidales bacterium]|nr:N-acetylmuramoyl-L-alanine amidase [Bacteroidales bacterium]
MIADYLIGVTKSGDVIFYQLDIQGRCCTGKIMKYNPDTGKRIKDESQPGRITWAHPLLKKQLPEKRELKQCLFGELLLTKYPDKPVVLVEAEKTAIIGSAVMPECNWLATGGKGQLNDRVDVLEGCKVVAFPDANAYGTWKEKVSERPWLSIHVMEADKFATCLYRAAQNHLPGHKVQMDYSDGDPDFEAPLYLLKHTYCPVVLTENLFMDAFPDYQFLLSEVGKKAIVALHVDGIVDYLRRR